MTPVVIHAGDGNVDMTSVHTTNPDHVDGPSSAARGDSVRLSLKPSSSAGGVLDGAWWPRSTDPAVELVALSEEVGARRAPVRRIGLNMAGWDSAPPRIRLASGRKIAVDWFRISSAHRVRVLSTDNQRIDLLLLPVETTPATAQLALTMATEGHDPEITPAGGITATPRDPGIEILNGAFQFKLEEARRLLGNVTAVVDALERGRRDINNPDMPNVHLRTLVEELTDALRETDNP
jgi:uncharacterized protein DUF5994